MDTNRPNVRGAAKFAYLMILIIIVLLCIEFSGNKENRTVLQGRRNVSKLF